jgi:hypothetical protein
MSIASKFSQSVRSLFLPHEQKLLDKLASGQAAQSAAFKSLVESPELPAAEEVQRVCDAANKSLEDLGRARAAFRRYSELPAKRQAVADAEEKRQQAAETVAASRAAIEATRAKLIELDAADVAAAGVLGRADADLQQTRRAVLALQQDDELIAAGYFPAPTKAQPWQPPAMSQPYSVYSPPGNLTAPASADDPEILLSAIPRPTSF